MSLTDKYHDVLELSDRLAIEGLGVTEKEGKLYISGTTPYQLEKDQVWDAIKTHPGWETELAADLRVRNAEVYGYWLVKSGDSLSKISKSAYNDGNKYMRIFEANKDVLKDPNTIQPGQKLKIPNP